MGIEVTPIQGSQQQEGDDRLQRNHGFLNSGGLSPENPS